MAVQTPEKTDLVDALFGLQSVYRLSDRAFADKLGVSNGLWSSMRREYEAGKTVLLGRKVLRGALQAYPHLRPEIEIYWQKHLDALLEG
jgi:hypothetical protein